MWNKVAARKGRKKYYKVTLNNTRKPIFSQSEIPSGNPINITDHIKKKCLVNK